MCEPGQQAPNHLLARRHRVIGPMPSGATVSRMPSMELTAKPAKGRPLSNPTAGAHRREGEELCHLTRPISSSASTCWT
jgi:hypothetical protein